MATSAISTSNLILPVEALAANAPSRSRQRPAGEPTAPDAAGRFEPTAPPDRAEAPEAHEPSGGPEAPAREGPREPHEPGPDGTARRHEDKDTSEGPTRRKTGKPAARKASRTARTAQAPAEPATFHKIMEGLTRPAEKAPAVGPEAGAAILPQASKHAGGHDAAKASDGRPAVLQLAQVPGLKAEKAAPTGKQGAEKAQAAAGPAAASSQPGPRRADAGLLPAAGPQPSTAPRAEKATQPGGQAGGADSAAKVPPADPAAVSAGQTLKAPAGPTGPTAATAAPTVPQQVQQQAPLAPGTEGRAERPRKPASGGEPSARAIGAPGPDGAVQVQVRPAAGSDSPAPAAGPPESAHQVVAAAREEAAPAAHSQTAGPAEPDPAPLPRTSPVEQVVERVRLAGARMGEQVVVRLEPPQLGRVRLTLHADGAEVRGVVEVDNPRTFLELQREVASLTSRLAEEGIDLRRLDLQLAGSGRGGSYDSAFDQAAGGEQAGPDGGAGGQTSGAAVEPVPLGPGPDAEPSALPGHVADGSINIWM